MVSEAIEKVQIVVDDRERPSGVVAELEKLDGVIVKMEHLVVGDYCVDGAVLIERKTAADFAQSLMGGRLFAQASRMAATPLRPAYILEGNGAEWSHLGVTREALQGALTRQLRVLQSLPGVGPDRAKRLLERFGMVRACFDASKTELEKVDGIGPKIAEAIDQIVS